MLLRKLSSTCLWILCLLFLGCNKTPDTTGDQPQPATSENESKADLLAEARLALGRNDLGAANSALRKQLMINPEDPMAFQLYSEVEMRRGDKQAALSYLRRAIELTSPPSNAMLSKAAELAMVCGKPHDSIELLTQLNETAQNDVQAKYDLIGLSAMVGVTHEGVPHLRWLLMRGKVDLESLQVLADPLRVQPDASVCNKALKTCPEDLRSHLGLALLESMEPNWQAVLSRLKPVIEKHKDFTPAFSLYGRALIESGQYDRIPAWHESLPADVKSDARYWIVAGLWAEHQGNSDQAAYAFGRSLKTDDVLDPRALQGLVSSLKELGRAEDAKKVSAQLAEFATMRDALKTYLDRKGLSQQAAVAVADSMVALGRIWEAEAWLRLSVKLPNDRVGDLRGHYQSIRSRLTVKTPWQLASQHLATVIDTSMFPPVDWAASDISTKTPTSSVAGKIRFEDQAEARGWIHTCDIARAKPGDGHWIYQSVGGGVSVVDYDLDGWPDLVAARLNGFPMQGNSSPNRLFRNQEGHFRDVSTHGNYQDTGYSGGIAVGDYNSDGYPDLYDANFGRNRLYRNNGDGTFSDISDEAGLKEEHWTTSTVIADVDGDALADIFEVAYCEEEVTLAEICHDKSGRTMTCSPLNLPAKSDSFYRGKGNGLFQNQTDRWLKQTAPGRGLGIIVAHLNELPGLDVYIANDMTANHLWSAQANDAEFKMVDVGVVSGVGSSGNSLSQASMGIAAADPDRDGDIDLFLTHFFDDHNTYYEQVRPGVWIDRSYQAGLSQPSIKLLGFGTEWIDFDNNGTLELIVANGHVDNFENSDIPYKMHAQVFTIDAGGRWLEMNSGRLGDYFRKAHVGRAVASVDVNRDGLTDVAITHLEEPVSLLVNRTEAAGASIGLTLKSTTSHRDAIGASVSAELDGEKVRTQLMAGDGYMCSNQRKIVIALGNAPDVKNLTITWPSGATEKIGSLAGGRDYVVVEGQKEAFEFFKHVGTD